MEKPGRVDRGGCSSGYSSAAFVGRKKGAGICGMVQQNDLPVTGVRDWRLLWSGAGFCGGIVSLRSDNFADCITDSK